MRGFRKHPVIFIDNNQTYELRCQLGSKCNANAKMVDGKLTFFDGHEGFQQHVSKFHKIAKFDPLEHCIYKGLTEDEVDMRNAEYVRGATGM
jgi:hypothetical protein